MNIAPIKLLSGHHEDTATTGSGCFMNVIAYLNGEAQITDKSPCVCITVIPLAIGLNDLGNDEQRQRLLPFVLRAMGSSTEDENIVRSRLDRLKQYGAECEELVDAWNASKKYNDCAINPYTNVNGGIDAYAKARNYAYAYSKARAYANAYLDEHSYAHYKAYVDAGACAIANTIHRIAYLKDSLFDAGLRYLDDVLPKLDTVAPEVLERSDCLVELFKKNKPKFV